MVLFYISIGISANYSPQRNEIIFYIVGMFPLVLQFLYVPRPCILFVYPYPFRPGFLQPFFNTDIHRSRCSIPQGLLDTLASYHSINVSLYIGIYRLFLVQPFRLPSTFEFVQLGLPELTLSFSDKRPFANFLPGVQTLRGKYGVGIAVENIFVETG